MTLGTGSRKGFIPRPAPPSGGIPPCGGNSENNGAMVVKTRGFTFVEILLVIALIGLMVGISAPRFKKTFNALQLQTFSAKLQAYMNYLRERSIVEGEILLLTIDPEKKECWVKIKDAPDRLKTYFLPGGINISATQKEVCFYPDGTIDKVTIKLFSPESRTIILTTEGVFSGVKLQPQE